MDWRNKEVYVGCPDDGRYKKMLEEMKAIESGIADNSVLDLGRQGPFTIDFRGTPRPVWLNPTRARGSWLEKS